MNRPPTMRRSAIDCIRRGWLNLRANWQLVPLAALGGFVTQALLVASLVPPILVLGGWELLDEASEVFAAADPVRLEAWMTAIADRALASGTPLLLSLVASTVIGLAFAAVWSFFHGATAGVLVAGDRQAPPSLRGLAGGPAGAWRWFRTYSWGDFSGWGGRYLWRFFGFFHLALLVPLVILALWLVVLVLAAAVFATAGPEAIGIAGCLSLLPLALTYVVFGLWAVLAQPALALGSEATVRRASGFALGTLLRRLGAVLLVGIPFFLLWAFAVAGLLRLEALTQALAGQSTAIQATFGAVQLVVGSVLSVFLAAVATALVVGESRIRGATP